MYKAKGLLKFLLFIRALPKLRKGPGYLLQDSKYPAFFALAIAAKAHSEVQRSEDL